MEQLLKVLPALLRAEGGSEQMAEAAVMAAWKHAVGEGLRDHAIPLRLDGKTLRVAVADAIWQKQLEAMSGQLLFRLNSLLGQSVVTFVHFVINPDAVRALRKEKAEAKKVSDESPVGSFELASAATSIADSELRKSFLRAADSCTRRLENNSSES
jgi:hypothetical protein